MNKQKMRSTLLKAAIPLEVLVSQIKIKPYDEITSDLQKMLIDGATSLREALAALDEPAAQSNAGPFDFGPLPNDYAHESITRPVAQSEVKSCDTCKHCNNPFCVIQAGPKCYDHGYPQYEQGVFSIYKDSSERSGS